MIKALLNWNLEVIEHYSQWYEIRKIKISGNVVVFMIVCNQNEHAEAYQTTMIPSGIYMFKVNNRNTRTRCETCSKLTTKM